MSAPAVVGVIQFVSTVYAAKTMVDGLREGHLAKAVIGGVGAYMGVSALASGAGATGAGAVGASGAKDVGIQNAARTVGTGATGAEAIQAGAGMQMGSASGGQFMSSGMAEGVTTGLGSTASAGGGKGLLSSAGKWISDNPKQAYGLMQVGGQALSGYAGQKHEKKLLAGERRREDEERERRNTWAPSPSYRQGRTFNPETGMMETVR